MNFAGLKKLHGQQVSLWPPPRVLPEDWIARMPWYVRVDLKTRVVELHASSGHFFDATDVIHHYQRHGDLLILDAQVVIRGPKIDLIPRPWGVSARELRRVARRRTQARQRRAFRLARVRQPARSQS